MNKLIRIFGFFAFAAGLRAGEQTIRVSVQDLEGWTITGAVRPAATDSADLSLPAGAQLSRAFNANKVALTLNATAAFGQTPDDSPTIEVGPVALMLSHNGSAGELLLFGADSAVPLADVPVTVGVGTAATAPVKIQIAYDRTRGRSFLRLPVGPR